jgi:hypothetical protein
MNPRPRILALFLMLLATTAGFMFSQTAGSNHAAIERQIIANERAILDAAGKGDVKTFHSMVPPDAVVVAPSGPIKVNSPEFDKMLTKIQTWNIDGSQFYWIGEATVVHMFRWTGTPMPGGKPISPSWNSTIWTNKSGKWVAVLHQESTTM